MPISPEALAGAAGGFIFAVWVAWQLWKAHREDDADVRRQRDGAVERLERVIGLAERGTREPPK